MLDGSPNEDSTMKKIVLASLALFFVLIQSVRVELVAQSPGEAPKSVEEVKEKMLDLDRRIESLKDLEVSLQSHAESLKLTMDAKVEELNVLRQSPDQLTEEAQRRGRLLMNGQEADQLEALKDIVQHMPRDEAVLLCGLAAKQSPSTLVRQSAIKAAASMGRDGYPAMAIAYESLSTEDRVYLIEQTREFDAADRAVIFALVAKNADEVLRKKLIAEPFADDRRLVLLGAIAKEGSDEVILTVIEEGAKINGEQGLMILYAAAKSKKPEHVLAALKAVRPRGKAAFPILAVASKSDDPRVRSELVRIAKELDGDEGKFIIKRMLEEKDPALRQAAEAALAQ